MINNQKSTFRLLHGALTAPDWRTALFGMCLFHSSCTHFEYILCIIIIIFGMGLFHSSCTHFEYLLYIIIMKCAWFIASSRHYLDCWYCGDQQIEVNMMILITSIITSLINTSLLGWGNLFCQFITDVKHKIPCPRVSH